METPPPHPTPHTHPHPPTPTHTTTTTHTPPPPPHTHTLFVPTPPLVRAGNRLYILPASVQWRSLAHKQLHALLSFAAGNRLYIMSVNAKSIQWRKHSADLLNIRNSFTVPLKEL